MFLKIVDWCMESELGSRESEQFRGYCYKSDRDDGVWMQQVKVQKMEESEILWRQYLWLLEELKHLDSGGEDGWWRFPDLGPEKLVDGGTTGGVVIWWESLDT